MSISEAQRMMDIVNDPPPDVPEEVVTSFTRFLDAMIELGKKLRGLPTDATFVKGENGEIVYYGLKPLPDGSFDSGYFKVPVMISSTLPGTSGVREKPAQGRLIFDNVFACVVSLDARRFLRCKICNKVFYARRLDALCCSRKHAIRYRTNEFRAKRRENYQYKKLRGLK